MYKHLTREQRYAIYLGKQKKLTNKAIARLIKVSESTVSRELRRNATKSAKYVWDKADTLSVGRMHRAPGNRAVSPSLIWCVKELIIQEQWSPKQISGYLAKEGTSISHETIYKIIRKDVSGMLASNCRHRMKYRRRPSHRHETKAPSIKNRVSIHERPKEANGKRFGDWEIDLIVDKDNHAILTMIERSTNSLIMEKLRFDKKAKPLARTVWRLLMPYKGENLKTITTDNGSEFAEHEWMARHLGLDVYCTDAYASWQKGAIENTNKLIRQYIPKGTDISTITDRKIKRIQAKINRRPREKLNFSTPKREFYKYYA